MIASFILAWLQLSHSPYLSFSSTQLSIFVFLIRRRKLSLLKRGMGHEDVPQGDPIWASTLTSERVERLNSIGFVWSTARPQRIEKPIYKPIYKPIIPLEFEEAFQKLVEYKEKHGHCIVKVHDKENPEVSIFSHNLADFVHISS